MWASIKLRGHPRTLFVCTVQSQWNGKTLVGDLLGSDPANICWQEDWNRQWTSTYYTATLTGDANESPVVFSPLCFRHPVETSIVCIFSGESRGGLTPKSKYSTTANPLGARGKLIVWQGCNALQFTLLAVHVWPVVCVPLTILQAKDSHELLRFKHKQEGDYRQRDVIKWIATEAAGKTSGGASCFQVCRFIDCVWTGCMWLRVCACAGMGGGGGGDLLALKG